jgi:hypothetical protein
MYGSERYFDKIIAYFYYKYTQTILFCNTRRMVSSRRNRNGPVSRLLSPVNEGLGLVTRTGSRVLNTGNSVWRSVGNGVRGIFSNATHSVNSAGRRLLKGKRGGSMRTRKNRNRKASMRNRSNRNRKASMRNRSNRNRKNRD